jgi:hypothetical protein
MTSRFACSGRTLNDLHKQFNLVSSFRDDQVYFINTTPVYHGINRAERAYMIEDYTCGISGPLYDALVANAVANASAVVASDLSDSYLCPNSSFLILNS